MLITPGNLSGLFQNFRFDYQSALEDTVTYYQQISMTIQSNTDQNVYAWMDRLPGLRQWVGERVIRNAIAQSFIVQNVSFELTEGIRRTTIVDDQYGIYSPMFKMMGMEAALWPDKQVLTSVVNGATNLCYDGQPFFNANHPIDTSNTSAGVQSNLFSLALTPTNYQTVRAAMRAYVGRDGNPLGILARGKAILMVGPALEQSARQMLQADYIAPAGAFGINAAVGMQSNTLKGSADLLVNPYITSATAWYILDVGMPIKPFVWQLREAPIFVYKNREEDDNVFMRDEFLYGVRARGAATYGPWFLAAQGNT